MKTLLRVILALSALMAAPVEAAEVRVAAARVLKPVLDELAPEFERATGHKVVFQYGPAGAIVKGIEGGEVAEVAIVQRPALERLAATGKVIEGTGVAVARSGVAVGIRKGAPRPDIGSVESFKQTLLAADSVAYPDPVAGNASGIHFEAVMKRLGIAEQIGAKAIIWKGMSFVEYATSNDAGIVITQAMDILSAPRYELVGFIPDALQDYPAFTWSAAVPATARDAGAGREFIRFLVSVRAATLIKRKGMEPGG